MTTPFSLAILRRGQRRREVRNITVAVLAILAFAALACLLPGCSMPANPHTRLRAGPLGGLFSFEDTKDNDIEIKGANYDPATGRFGLDSLVIRNNASDVRRANVEQMRAYTEQVQAVTNMVNMATQAIASKIPNFGGGGPAPLLPLIREAVTPASQPAGSP